MNGSRGKTPQDPAAHYEVGPGFEIAIRADAGRPVQVTLKGERGGAAPPGKGGDAGHRHDATDQRLDAIERSIFLLAQHMQRLDERLSGAGPVGPQRKP